MTMTLGEMVVARKVLASMDTPYAVTLDVDDAGLVAYAASEKFHGSAMVFRGPEWKPAPIASRPGGCMGVVPLHSMGKNGVLMIEDFFPIFQSAGSGGAIYSAMDSQGHSWGRRRVFDLPFLHRVALIHPHGKPLFIAGQLCRDKNGFDDWSHAGAIYSIEPTRDGSPWTVNEQPLLDGLHRNHGLFVQRRGGVDEVYVAADEGVFLLTKPNPDQPWVVEQLLDVATSDLWLFDLDGDGVQEMATIHPFHGDTARIHKRLGTSWEAIWEERGEFGHVVWAGRLCGREGLILGWREGGRNLDLHLLENPRHWRFRRVALDQGVAPLNISVHHGRDADHVLASHGATHEVVLYTFTQ